MTENDNPMTLKQISTFSVLHFGIYLGFGNWNLEFVF